MIASIRKAHRRLLQLLVLPTFLLFAVSVWTRLDIPSVAALPEFDRGGIAKVGAGGDPLWQREDLFMNWPARVVAYPQGSIELKPLRAIAAPDLLLYWTSSSAVRASLPSDAYLLGKVGDTRVQRFQLPAQALRVEGADSVVSGSLILYSLGHQTIVTIGRLPVASSGADASRDRVHTQ